MLAAARADIRLVRITCFLLALANWLWASVIALTTYLAWGFQCDGGCVSESWSRSPDAPQWTLLPVLGASAWAAATLFLIGPRRLSVRASAIAAELALICGVEWLAASGDLSRSIDWMWPGVAAVMGLSALYLRTAYPLRGRSEDVPEVA
jgi:hypothetical protein